jgi:hypothetical protein
MFTTSPKTSETSQSAMPAGTSAVTGYVCPERNLSVGEMWAFCAA